MKKYFQFLLFIFFVLTLNAQTKITIEEAISIALQKNPDLLKSTNNLKNNKADLKSSYGALLPNMSLNSSFSWNRDASKGYSAFDELRQIEVIIPEQTKDSRYYSLGISGGVTLFDGLSNFANISQSQKDLESAEFRLEKLKQDIILGTTEYFYYVLNKRKQLEVHVENVKYQQKQLETIMERNRLGAVALADVYQQQVATGNAELNLIRAESDYESTKNSLLNYLSLDVLTDYELVEIEKDDNFATTQKYIDDFNQIGSMIQLAFQNRLDYKSSQLGLQSLEDGITIANSGLYPRLSGNYSWGTSAIEPNKLFDGQRYSAGISLSYPIFSNFLTDQRVQAAEIQVQNAKEDMGILERKIKIEVKQGYLDLITAKKALDVATKTVFSAEENRKINKAKYDLGSGTIVEVLQADQAYTSAISGKYSALYEFYRLKDRLKNYLGELKVKNYEK